MISVRGFKFLGAKLLFNIKNQLFLSIKDVTFAQMICFFVFFT